MERSVRVRLAAAGGTPLRRAFSHSGTTSWKSAGSMFRGEVSQDQWVAALKRSREPLGALVSRTAARIEFANSLRGAPWPRTSRRPRAQLHGPLVGHWDGDTLVVESTGFRDRTWLDMAGHPHTEALRITERFRRRDFGHMEISETIDDPGVFNKVFTITINAELVPDTDRKNGS